MGPVADESSGSEAKCQPLTILTARRSRSRWRQVPRQADRARAQVSARVGPTPGLDADGSQGRGEITMRARPPPSATLTATPRPSARLTATTARRRPATSPGVLAISAVTSRSVPPRNSGALRIAVAIRACSESGADRAAAIEPKDRARPASVIAMTGAPQPSTASAVTGSAATFPTASRIATWRGAPDRDRWRCSIRPPQVASIPACLPEQFCAIDEGQPS